jgi:hypothetical protein
MAVASKSIPQVRQRARSGGQVGRIVRSIVMIGGLGFFSAWTLPADLDRHDVVQVEQGDL